ncbi:Outer membrane protein RomA [Pseudoalteromonas luteoviolacea B = ATCC 29581]|nr:Outer membrane protein RomA [Pseudoalteromonas luteoviolacea B = ATCC 29581]
MKRIILLLVSGSIFGVWLMLCNLNSNVDAQLISSTQYYNNRFHNALATEPNSFTKSLKILWRFVTEKRENTVPEHALPIQHVTAEQLIGLDNSALHIIKLGHSSLLLKVYGEYWLIDPVFSNRASPFQFIGPKRFQPTPIHLDDLPPIDRVLISHNHYDHLDKATIKALSKKATSFYVPLGVEGDLKRFGVASNNIHSFDWWQTANLESSTITFTPTQHFSGRGLNDSNTTLWGSWVIKAQDKALFFSGDSGYFSGFKTIGERFGPFDLTFIETGAYDKDWHDIHMTPEESVQAHIDLQGKIMIPIHNGTFDLAFHSWTDPLERVTLAADANQITLTLPIIGEVLTLHNSTLPNATWWKIE